MLLVGFFGTLTISNIFAAGGELNSGNIVTEYGCAIDATNCNLKGLGITSIAVDTFVNHTNLIDLYLSSNQISELPTGIFDSLSGLQQLYLSENKISVLPTGIFDSLTGLTYLDLDSNQLSSIYLSGFSKLERLSLNYNELNTIILSGLSSLNYLECYVNQITEINLSELTSLTHLDLSYNQLTEIIGLETLSNISKGNIEQNNFSFGYIDNNQDFFDSHNISYYPQKISNDDE